VGELACAAGAVGVDAHVLGDGEEAAAIARQAAAAGAPAIGMAGGDGSLGRVAAVALERELPFVCIPFGSRNHFAHDLGIPCDDPLATLEAFRGEERLVDVGRVAGAVFLTASRWGCTRASCTILPTRRRTGSRPHSA
jgi:diacylglycerol kinase family enzyme